MNVLLLAEAVNPVYRRNRIAKVLRAAKKHRELEAHWSKIDDTHENSGRKISHSYIKRFGNNYSSWPASAKKQHNAEHDRNAAKQAVSSGKVIHHVEQRVKAYNIAHGRYELPSGETKWRGIPSNPLRKNRDETLGKHNRTMQVVKDMRTHDKEAKAASAKWKAIQALTARKKPAQD